MKKKFTLLFFTGIFAISIVACNNESSSSNSAEETIVNTEAVTENIFPNISPKDIKEYSTDFFTLSYNNEIYKINTSENELAHYYQIKSDYIKEVDDTEYNTVCAVIEYNNSLYEDIGSQSVENYLNNYGNKLFNSHHDPIVSSDFISNENFSEVQVTLSGNTKYYVKLLSLNPEVSVMVILRLCDYTSYYNDSLMDIYNSVSVKNFTDKYPLVTYSDIQTGKYNGQKVRIDAIVDKANVDDNDSDFALWYPTNDTYIYDSMNGGRDISPISSTANFLNLKNGDILRYATQVYDDGSFGTVTTLSSEIVGHEDIESVHNAFKQSCPSINYDDLIRNPDDYKEQSFKIYGKIFQVIDESDYSAEYLISTDFGYIYASWYDDKEVRGSRLIDGDNVVLYGKFTGLKTYNSLIKENTVPDFSVILIDLE